MPTAAVLAVTAVGGAIASKKSGDKAIKASSNAADKATLQTQESKNRAREDLERLFPQAQQSANQGFQSALDVFGQSLPAQTDVFQQGNLGAQQAIISSLPQMQNALFGNPVDLSQMQPFQVQQPDMGFFQQQTPVTLQNQAQAEQEAAAQQQALFTQASLVGPEQNPGIGILGGFGNNPRGNPTGPSQFNMKRF